MGFQIENGVLKKYTEESGVTQVVIPEGVTVIDVSAFQNCSSLVGITVSEGVKEIKKRAFIGCSSLETVDIPTSTEKIDFKAFEGCTSLSELRISDDNKKFCSVERAVYSKNKKNLFFVPIETAGEFNIPDGVQIIGKDAFTSCANLEKITIPDTVKTIPKNAFAGCFSLKSIKVDKENAFYSSADGILINKVKKQLVIVPKSKEGSVEIPSGVTSIETKAFEWRLFVTSVTIPDSLSYFPKNTFDHSNDITTLTMRGITFSYWWNVPVNDVAEMLTTKNYHIKMEHDTKYSIVTQVFLKTAQPEAEEFIRKETLKIIRHFIDLNDYATVKGLLESGKFVTKRNIDKLIDHAIANTQNGGDMQIQLLLTNYKHEKFGVSDSISKFKL